MADLELLDGALWMEWFQLPAAAWGEPGPPITILHQVWVARRLRGRGLGTQLLLCAQRRWDRLLLAPVPEHGLAFSVEEWYGRHGFLWTPAGGMMEWQRGWKAPPVGRAEFLSVAGEVLRRGL